MFQNQTISSSAELIYVIESTLHFLENSIPLTLIASQAEHSDLL